MGPIYNTDGDVVVVVHHDQISQLQMPCQTCSLTGYAFHSAAIPEKAVGMVVEQLEAGLVEHSRCMPLCNGKTDGVAEPLTQRAGCDLDTFGVVGFGVTRRNAID